MLCVCAKYKYFQITSVETGKHYYGNTSAKATTDSTLVREVNVSLTAETLKLYGSETYKYLEFLHIQ